MSFFDNLLGRAVKPVTPRAAAADADPFAGQGFVYSETVSSPDGSIKVYNGYSGGDKGATVIEAKVVVASTGRVLFDLWNTYQHCSIQFAAAGRTAMLRVQNAHNGAQREVTINFENETFAFTNDAAVWHPLSQLAERVSTF